MVTFRPYQKTDAPVLLDLFRQTVRRVNSKDYNPEQIAAWSSDSIDPEVWAQRFEGRQTTVAVNGDQLVGFAELTMDGAIDRFYVHAEYQGRGLGGRMLAILLKKARELGLKRLTVEASITAKPFFESQGFTHLGSQVVHCRGAYLVNFRMERSLTQPAEKERREEATEGEKRAP